MSPVALDSDLAGMLCSGQVWLLNYNNFIDDNLTHIKLIAFFGLILAAVNDIGTAGALI